MFNLLYILILPRMVFCGLSVLQQIDSSRMAVVEVSRQDSVLWYEKARINFMWNDGKCIAAIKHRPENEDLTIDEHMEQLDTLISNTITQTDIYIRIVFLTNYISDEAFLSKWDLMVTTYPDDQSWVIDADNISCEIFGRMPSIYNRKSEDYEKILEDAFATFAEWKSIEEPENIIGFITFCIGVKETVRVNIPYVPTFEAFVNHELKQILLVETFKPNEYDSNLNHVANKLNNTSQYATLSSDNLQYKIYSILPSPKPFRTATKINRNWDEDYNNIMCNRCLAFRFKKI